MRERKTIENDLEYLKQISKNVDFYDEELLNDIESLTEYCRSDPNFFALAAVQIGIPKRLVYIKKTDLNTLEDPNHDESLVMINPVILEAKGKTRYLEACASCLDNSGVVERPYYIKLRYYDINKNEHIEDIEGFKATVVCHELDHLDGILHIEKSIELFHMNFEQRQAYRELHPYQIISKE